MKLAIVTSTRAEYGLLKPILEEFKKFTKEVNTYLIVTGTHLSERFGKTINEIEDDGIQIAKTIEIPTENNSSAAIASDMAITLTKFTEYFTKENFDFVMILGDRYEIFMVALAATLCKIPIVHLYGGDTTEGAMDEFVRHSITKMSYLHFASNKQSANRIIQLGEDPKRVFSVGGTGTDNIVNVELFKENEIRNYFSIKKNEKVALGTYHPVTLNDENPEKYVIDFLEALKEFPNIFFIITKANSDLGGDKINEMLIHYSENIHNVHIYSSLGMKRYLSVMKMSEFVIGNSSSGIYETPSLRIPTINIGNRQGGRLQASSIINSKEDRESIVNAIETALSYEFRTICKNTISPYGDGHAAENIVKIFLEERNKNINLEKKFYDII